MDNNILEALTKMMGANNGQNNNQNNQQSPVQQNSYGQSLYPEAFPQTQNPPLGNMNTSNDNYASGGNGNVASGSNVGNGNSGGGLFGNTGGGNNIMSLLTSMMGGQGGGNSPIAGLSGLLGGKGEGNGSPDLSALAGLFNKKGKDKEKEKAPTYEVVSEGELPKDDLL